MKRKMSYSTSFFIRVQTRIIFHGKFILTLKLRKHHGYCQIFSDNRKPCVEKSWAAEFFELHCVCPCFWGDRWRIVLGMSCFPDHNLLRFYNDPHRKPSQGCNGNCFQCSSVDDCLSRSVRRWPTLEFYWWCRMRLHWTSSRFCGYGLFVQLWILVQHAGNSHH